MSYPNRNYLLNSYKNAVNESFWKLHHQKVDKHTAGDLMLDDEDCRDVLSQTSNNKTFTSTKKSLKGEVKHDRQMSLTNEDES